MSQNNTNAKTAMLAKLDSIHKVEGFDPVPVCRGLYGSQYAGDAKASSCHDPMAWFRLKYPGSRIAIQVSPGQGLFCGNGAHLSQLQGPG